MMTGKALEARVGESGKQEDRKRVSGSNEMHGKAAR
jgi:hypothetical protein